MKPKAQDIITSVCSVFEVTREDIISATRGEFRIAYARQAAMALCRELTSMSLPRIGNQFGRDHTTVLYAVNKVRDRANEDPGFRDSVDTARSLALSLTETRRKNIAEALSQPLVLGAAQ